MFDGVGIDFCFQLQLPLPLGHKTLLPPGIYWVTKTINSSTRIYYEDQHNPEPLKLGDRSLVPTAVALFAKDITHPPRELAERLFNVQRWTEIPQGGHFAAIEEPELLVEDIRAFFRPLR